jgi:hypothetical protein
MAVIDDLNRLAAQDVVYLAKTLSGGAVQAPGFSTEVFRGRVRQALDGNWVFNASTGQNGVVGFMLGSTGQNLWTSSDLPASGLQVTVQFGAGQQVSEVIALTSLIPADFTD